MSEQKESETYQNMMIEVERILAILDRKDLDLDAMVKQVEQGYQLISDMKNRLEETRQKVETLQVSWEQQDNKDGAVE